MRTINYEEYWATIDNWPVAEHRELVYSAFEEAPEFESVEAFLTYSREVLIPASIAAATMNGCFGTELADFYEEMLAIAVTVAGGDPSRLSLGNDADNAYFRGQVEQLEQRFAEKQLCHPAGSLFHCYCA